MAVDNLEFVYDENSSPGHILNALKSNQAFVMLDSKPTDSNMGYSVEVRAVMAKPSKAGGYTSYRFKVMDPTFGKVVRLRDPIHHYSIVVVGK